MKKNKMMRAASGLLIATLLTTSVIAGTFAKYTTSADGTDTARVAKWGVKITANGDTFAEEYTNSSSAKTVVSSAKGTDVIAPGTSGTMATMALSGTPEVSVKVSYVGAFALDDNWTVGENNTFYCPLIIKVKNGTDVTTIQQSESVNSIEAFNMAVNNAIKEYSKEYAAGTDLSTDTVKGDSLTVTWEWPFENASITDTDKNDTALGDATTAATVTLKVTTTVTQID